MMEKIGHVERNLLLFVPIIILLVVFIPLDNIVLRTLFGPGVSCGGGLSGVNVAKGPDGKLIGLSYGAAAFDVDGDRTDQVDKQQAAQAITRGDTTSAVLSWQKASAEDSSDAEPDIYLENLRVQDSGSPYFTLVTGTTLTGDIKQGGRSILQGAYIAQVEYNNRVRQSGGKLLRLLIANAGSDQVNAKAVACQVVQAAQADKTIVGVMGWDYSGASLSAIQTLNSAHIPMLSATSSSDFLEGLTSNFWRIVPPDSVQANSGATYAKEVMKSKKVVIFEDGNDFYSRSLADDFRRVFTSSMFTSVIDENYTRNEQNEKERMSNQLQAALNQQPDLIYFSGYWGDANTLLTDLSELTTQTMYKRFAHLPVMGGDALSVIARYPSSIRPKFTNVYFTSFAATDEWSYLCSHGEQKACQTVPFFAEYRQAFDPQGKQPSNTYGYNLPDAYPMLAYDGIQTFITAYQRALRQHQSPTPVDLQQALSTIKGKQSIQGISGQISFDSRNDPFNKSIVIVGANLATDAMYLVSINVGSGFLKSP